MSENFSIVSALTAGMQARDAFSIPLALEMASWSSAAYSDYYTPTPCFIGSSDGKTTGQLVSNTATDIHALIITQPDKVVIAFRGTHSLHNWMTDADCDQVPSYSGSIKFHRGFAKAYDSIKDKLWANIDVPDTGVLGKYGKGLPLHITGHSLGGALAKLFALNYADWCEIRHEHCPIASVLTFGEPRWGNHAAAHQYDYLLGSRTVRLVHSLDPVAHIPAFAPGFPPKPFWKTRNNAWLWDDGTWQKNRPWLQTLPRAIRCAWQEQKRGEHESIPDHYILHYIAALEKAKAKYQPASENAK